MKLQINTKMHLNRPLPGLILRTLLLQPFYGLLSGTTKVSRYQIHSLPHILIISHPLSAFSVYYPIHSLVSSLFNLRAWQSSAQPLSKSSLVNILAWHPPLHTPYISSPNHCLLFTTHVHTVTTGFAVGLPRLGPMSSNRSLSQPFNWNSILGWAQLLSIPYTRNANTL